MEQARAQGMNDKLKALQARYEAMQHSKELLEQEHQLQISFQESIISLDELQERLPVGVCVVEIHLQTTALLQVLITKDGVIYVATKKFLFTERHYVHAFVKACSRRDGDWLTSGRQLRKLLLELLLPSIPSEVTHLVFITDKLFAKVPFHAMPLEREGTDGVAQFLCERWRVSYLPSASNLLHSVPVHGLPAGRQIVAGGALAMTSKPELSDHEKPLIFLPGSKEEVTRIGELLGNTAEVLIGQSCTKQGLLAALRGGPREDAKDIETAEDQKGKEDLYADLPPLEEELIDNQKNEEQTKDKKDKGKEKDEDNDMENVIQVVHLSTHGDVVEDFPLSSYMAMSNGENLRVRDFVGMKLDIHLFVLSACMTGIGAGEGNDPTGFTRTLLSVGVKNLVVSLWSVDDEATTQFMLEFYKALLEDKSLTLSEALAKTQSVMRGLNGIRPKSTRNPEPEEFREESPSSSMMHPFFWAGFIVIETTF